MIPTFTFYRDGYWFAVVGQGHPLAGTKSMALKKKHALRIVREVASSALTETESAYLAA